MITILAIVISLFILYYLTIAWVKGVDENIPTQRQDKKKKSEIFEVSKAALKDLELEYSLGKINEKDFIAARNEMVTEIAMHEKSNESIDKKSDDEKSKTNVSSLLIFISLFFLIQDLQAYEIKVNFINKTAQGTPARVNNVELLLLENGMQSIKKISTFTRSVSFTDLAPPKNGPYMVRADFHGITYSKVIPPNFPSGKLQSMPVYEATNNFDSKKISFRTVQEVQYIEGGYLNVLHIYFFNNRTLKTFANKDGGIRAYIPKQAEKIEALVSVGSGNSNIEWLKVKPKISSGQSIFSTISYPIKPGERVYQILYQIPYSAQRKAFRYFLPYALEIPVQLVVFPDDIKVSSATGTPFSFEKNKELDRKIYEVPAQGGGYEFVLSEGTPLPPPSNEDSSVEVNVASPLQDWQKIVFPLGLLISFLGIRYWLNLSPAWLQKAQIKELAKLKTEKEILMQGQPSAEHIHEIDLRLNSLTKWVLKKDNGGL